MQNCMAGMRRARLDLGARAEQALFMHRHDFLSWIVSAGGVAAGGAALGLAACAAPIAVAGAPAAPRRAAPGGRAKIRGICFDLFTLFDPRSVVTVAHSIAAERAVELCEAWRSRQFEYAWLRVAAGQYQDFRVVTAEALLYAARGLKLELSAGERERLVEAYSQLEPWPDTRAALLAWKQAGLRLAPLANYSPSMISKLLAHAGLSELFDAQISTDVARTFKPDPRAYGLGPATLGLEREQIAFAAFGGWDAAGARWFGYPTFWVNRLGVPAEELAPGPDATGPTLAELARFVTEW
jgi:2-haloacid dehalogenase